MIRTAGEVVNTTTPAGYVGGEPLKASLLRKHHVPMEEAFTSVIIAKTTMTIAEVLFILLGPAEGRGERVISALGKQYVNVDAPCIVV